MIPILLFMSACKNQSENQQNDDYTTYTYEELLTDTINIFDYYNEYDVSIIDKETQNDVDANSICYSNGKKATYNYLMECFYYWTEGNSNKKSGSYSELSLYTYYVIQKTRTGYIIKETVTNNNANPMGSAFRNYYCYELTFVDQMAIMKITHSRNSDYTMIVDYTYLNIIAHSNGIYIEYYLADTNNKNRQVYLYNYNQNGIFEYNTNTFLVGTYVDYDSNSSVKPLKSFENFSLPEFRYNIT